MNVKEMDTFLAFILSVILLHDKSLFRSCSYIVFKHIPPLIQLLMEVYLEPMQKVCLFLTSDYKKFSTILANN